jgi:inorganic pyrophosphatase
MSLFLYRIGGNHMIGEVVKVIIDRPLRSSHPVHRDMIYPVNYGYIEGIFAFDKEEQDAYILGVHEPIKEFTGHVIAIVVRHNDNESKWVVAPIGMNFSKREISDMIWFQEQYFQSEIITSNDEFNQN